ncbi:MAG: hypothetical protein J6P58_03305 [Oscillospiraceae bacterium]|nr:hypothetical protein [Oscillospiraceae bacterium]
MNYYIASCVFTSQFPELSEKIREYIRKRWGFETVRCCIPKYKLQEFEEKMPKGCLRDAWAALPDSGAFTAGDCVWSLCHNCSNIIEEMHPGTEVHSLWELIDSDAGFPLPDLTGMTATVQDCWRSRGRADEQKAVRSLLDKMGVRWEEAPRHHADTKFCGVSLLRPQPPRNPKLAPRHYVDGTEGLFLPHTEEEQKAIMTEYCGSIRTDTVICYCHYCLEGLLLGGKDAKHIAQLLF